MRTLQFLIFFFFMTSCFAMVKKPSKMIYLDKTIISSLDSLNVVDGLQGATFQDGKKVNPGSKKYYFPNLKKGLRIALKFKDGHTYLFDTSVIKSDDRRVIIKMKYGGPIIHQYSKFESVYPIMLVALLVLFLTKLPIVMLILQPESRRKFILKYSALIFFSVLIFFIETIFKTPSLGFILLQLFVLAPIFDSIYIWIINRQIKKLKLFFASIVSNLTFNTIGIFLMYYISAKLDF